MCDFRLHNNTSQKNWPWWRVVCDFTLHNNTSQKNWPWWREVCDFTLHIYTSQKKWHWWKVVWDFTLHNNTSQKDAKCIVMAAWILHGACVGEEAGHETLYFSVKVAAGGDEKYLLCAAGAAAVGLPFFLPHCNGGLKLLWFCLCVRIVLGCFGICRCRSHWNGCMIVVTWCCHVRRYVQVCDVMLRNAM